MRLVSVRKGEIWAPTAPRDGRGHVVLGGRGHSPGALAGSGKGRPLAGSGKGRPLGHAGAGRHLPPGVT